MTKRYPTEAMYFSAKGHNSLEESHFQAAKMPNRLSVDAKSLWAEGLMTLET
jgi:hypothetical protein